MAKLAILGSTVAVVPTASWKSEAKGSYSLLEASLKMVSVEAVSIS
jgi:hypothetical protein